MPQNERRVIDPSLELGMAGLKIEAREVEVFPGNMTEAEAQHAHRYVLWETAGFPLWLEGLYRTCRDTVLSTICNELLWDLAHARPEPLNNILSNLFYRAPWIHEPLAPSIAAWMEQNEIQNHDAL